MAKTKTLTESVSESVSISIDTHTADLGHDDRVRKRRLIRELSQKRLQGAE